MITGVGVTKTFYYVANMSTEVDQNELDLPNALECLEKCLTDTGSSPHVLSLSSEYGSLEVDIRGHRHRQKWREVFIYLIFVDIYGEKRGSKKFYDYMEDLERNKDCKGQKQ